MSIFNSTAAIETYPRTYADSSDVRTAFRERQEELQWLAFFITADEAVAAECVTDACALTEKHNSVFEQWLATWARYATIRAAINHQHNALKELMIRYEGEECPHGAHPKLSSELLDRVIDQTEWFVESLDVLQRAALVICGVEGHSVSEASLLLGLRKTTVLSAYCAALAALEAGPGAAQYHDIGVADRWF